MKVTSCFDSLSPPPHASRAAAEVMSLSDAGSQKRWEYWLDYMQIRIHPSFTSSGAFAVRPHPRARGPTSLTAPGYAIRDVPAPLFRGLTGFFKEQWFGNKGVAESEVPYFITGLFNTYLYRCIDGTLSVCVHVI